MISRPDFRERAPFPDHNKSVIDGFVDDHCIADLSVHHGEKNFALMSSAEVTEPVGSRFSELKHDAIGILVVRRKGPEGDNILGADCRTLQEKNLFACGQLLEDIPVPRFSLKVKADIEVWGPLPGSAGEGGG